jgi:hypothetical protein
LHPLLWWGKPIKADGASDITTRETALQFAGKSERFTISPVQRSAVWLKAIYPVPVLI